MTGSTELPVTVTRLVQNERIEFLSDAEEGGYQTEAAMTFEATDGGGTQMPCCRKACLEHKINLRQGFI